MSEEINWERVAKNFQIENEDLRREVSKKRNPVEFDLSFDLYYIVDWVERHYLFVIALTFVIGYIVTTTIDIVDRRRSKWREN